MTLVTKLELIQSGSTLDVSDETNYVHAENDGFGMAPLHRLDERGPQQHGDSDRGYRLDPRIINLVIAIIGSSWDDFYEKREALLSHLLPTAKTILRFTKSNGDVRQIDCYAVRGPFYASSDMIGAYAIKAGFTLKASDPTFYDPAGESLTFQLGGGGGAWEFPMEVPWTVGASAISQTQIVTYDGTFETYPTLIRITGPITDPVITNLTTGEALDFDGVTIGAGDYYDLNLQYGSKTVKDSSGDNKLADLTSDSDLATWHIATAPEAPGGINSIKVEGSGVTTTTKVEITFFNRYIGL